MADPKKQLAQINTHQGDKRSSVTGSNISLIVDKAIAALPADQQKTCDHAQLVSLFTDRGSTYHCRTVDDIILETRDEKGEKLAEELIAKKIGHKEFVKSLETVANAEP